MDPSRSFLSRVDNVLILSRHLDGHPDDPRPARLLAACYWSEFLARVCAAAAAATGDAMPGIFRWRKTRLDWYVSPCGCECAAASTEK